VIILCLPCGKKPFKNVVAAAAAAADHYAINVDHFIPQAVDSPSAWT